MTVRTSWKQCQGWLVLADGRRALLVRLVLLPLVFVFVLVLGVTPVFALSYFSALDEQVIERLGERFGAEAPVRLLAWRRRVGGFQQSAKNDQERLAVVNRLANRVPYEEDEKHWGTDEYWATPIEFVASNGGDCDDYAITKYFALIELGVAPEKLRMTYVRALYAKGITHHMVLAYYPQPTAQPLILDNLIPDILPADRRPDLMPVLSFNDSESWSGRGARQTRTGPGVVRQWSELRRRMQLEISP